MAIDQRQVHDLSNLMPNIVSDGLDYGDDPGLLVSRNEESNEIHIGLVLPTKLDPNYVEPEPEPEPEIPPSTTDPGAPTKALNEYSIDDIVKFVRAGYGSKFPVGSMIPISLQNFRIVNNARDTRTYGGHHVLAVVLGHDHNLAKETPHVEHTMTLALMYRWVTSFENSVSVKQPMAFASKSAFTGGVIANIESAIMSALPPNWQEATVQTTKTGSSADNSSVKSKTSKIFIPSYYEVFGYQGHIDKQNEESWRDGAQQQYQYFLDKGFPTNFYYYTGGTTGSVVVTASSSSKPFMIASRSPVYSRQSSSILLTNTSAAKTGMNLFNMPPTGGTTVLCSYNPSCMINNWISQTGNTTSSGSYFIGDNYKNDVYATSSYITVTVGLNQRHLEIGTSTSYKLKDIGRSYLFTGAGVIPCFNIG